MEPTPEPVYGALRRAPGNRKRKSAASVRASPPRPPPDSSPTTSLIPDFVRCKGSASVYATLPFRLSKCLSRRAQRRSGGDKIDEFSVLTAAAMLVLHRYASNSCNVIQEGLTLGAPPLAGASDTAICSRVVFFHKDILLHEALRDHIADVLHAVREGYRQCTGASNRIAETLLNQASSGPTEPCGILVTHENLHGCDAARSIDAALTLQFRHRGEYLEGQLRYRHDELSERTATQFIRHFSRVLQFMLSHPDAPVLEVPLLTPGEYRDALRHARGPQRRYPTERPINALIEEHAHLCPDLIAAEDRTGALTYSALNVSANKIANLLIDLGAKPGEFTAVLHERSIGDLVFKLAALKAGIAFVPIDPSYPPDRVAFMLQNCEARFLLTDCSALGRYSGTIEQCKELEFIVLSDRLRDSGAPIAASSITCYDRDSFSLCSAEDPAVGTTGRDLCYMIYTSGSSGRPKGAMIRHDGAINHIYAECELLRLTQQFRLLQSAPASSDISIWQYFGPLLMGGCTVIVDTATVFDAEQLFCTIKSKRISVVELVPVVLRSLLEYVAELAAALRTLPDLKWMMVTGEAVPVDLVNWWLSLYPSIKVVNAYGPSEASDDVTQMAIDRPLPPNQRSVPIGRPLPNCRVYIVDRNNMLAPRGVPGEICVSGICVGTGYWRNEAMTSAAFVADPFVEDSLQNMYRTGDLGRWLADGTIEFLGRIDQQVAIRGFRVELEEVEAVLREHPLVTAAAARIWEDDHDAARLAGYVVADGGSRPDPTDLRRFMLERLPDYMVPSVLVKVDKLPLTPSGKVDRRALPVPRKRNVLHPQKHHIPPRTATELSLSRIWAKSLSLGEVGIGDNFFELGGDSILGIQVSNLARKAGFALQPSQVLHFPTIKQLADLIDASQPRSSGKDVAGAANGPSLATNCNGYDRCHHADSAFPLSGLKNAIIEELQRRFNGIDDIYPLGPAQQGIYIQCLLARKPGAYVEQTSIDLRGDVDHAALLRAWQMVTERYPALRTGFARRGVPKPMQVVVSDVAIELRCHDWRHMAHQKQAEHWLRLLEEDRAMPFTLEKPPLHRLTLIRLDEHHYRLLLTYHHLAIDGWSEPIILGQLLRQYKNICSGQQSEVAVDHTYHSYIAWLVQRDPAASSDFWRRKLKGFTCPSQLVVELEKETCGRRGFAWLAMRLSAKATASLCQFARRRRLTLNTVLQAAWALTIAHYSHSLDVVYGTTVSGRQAPIDGIEAMVGMAVNTLPVRVQINPLSPLDILLHELQCDLFDIQAFEYSMLAQVQSLSDVPRDRQPIVRSLFTLANYPDTTDFGSRLTSPKIENVQLITVPDFPITCFAVPVRQLLVRLVYDRQRFEEGNVTDILVMYVEILEAFLTNPRGTVARVVKRVRRSGAQGRLPQGVDFLSQRAQFLPLGDHAG